MGVTLTLAQIVALVGRLDDSPGDDTPRERFRRFLSVNVTNAGQLRDYAEECLRTPGDQYSRALQDLVNHLGRFLGFDVEFGRYQGVRGQIGFDGLWKSPSGLHVVIEAKTSQVFAIRTATLLGYVNDLVSDGKRIPNWDRALGLYVLGRLDPEANHLQNAIVAEKHTDRLRIVSVDSLLSLAELMSVYDVKHEDILVTLCPSSPTVDPLVDLMRRLATQRQSVEGLGVTETPTLAASAKVEPETPPNGEGTRPVSYWITPVRAEDDSTPEEVIRTLVGQEMIYAVGDRTPGRKVIKPGDWICFYASTKGVVAHGRVVSEPEKKPHPKVRHSEAYPWVFKLTDTRLYLDDPVVVDSACRSQLDFFKDSDPNASYWGILV